MAAAIDGRLLPWWASVQSDVTDAGEDATAVALVLERPVPKLGNVGKAGNWNVPVATVREAAKAVVAAHEEARRCVRQHLLEHLLPALVDFTVDGAEARRRAALLEYHDLLVRARRLLRADPAVRAAVARRHQVVLVDEFQDTDPLQVDLAVLACTSEAGPIPDDRPWSDLPVAPGRLFFVGDPKQSIYRFRRADIDLYARVRDGLGGHLVPLVANFRSTGSVVDAVNAAFGPWFAEQGEGQAPWRDLVAGRDGGPEAGTVAVLGGVQHGVPAQQARELAAADVVACARLALDRRWPVFDARCGTWRPARADDITVLLPTRTALPALERAFEDAGLPYRVEARSLVWATQEVRDLLSVLRAVADPGDDVAVVAALLSGVLACSYQDLSTWRAAGGSWDHGACRPAALGPDHPVAEAMACLARWAGRAPWVTPAGLLDLIVRERAVLEAAFAQPRQREAWNRARFLGEQARTVAASGTSALRAFVDWADRQADEEAQALESVVPEPDDQAVRVLTIHSAKGLEFPITIVAGLNVPRGGAVIPTTRVLWGPAGQLELSCGAQQRGFRTAGFVDLAAREQRRAEQEQARLLYVACTRARDHLVVCTHRTGSTRDESSAAADLSTWLAPVPGVLSSLDDLALVPGLPEERVAVAPSVDPSIATSEAITAWEGRRRAALATAGRPAAIPATAVAQLDDPDAPLTLALGMAPSVPAAALAGPGGDAGGEEGEIDPATARGMPFGRAVHAVLERAALGSPLDPGEAEVAERVASVAEAEEVDAAAVLATASAALVSPAAVAAASARRCWREAFVAAEIEGVVVEGFVDLLWEDDAGLHVADWKTDRLTSAEERRARAGRYALQLATYAVALEHVAGRPVVELALVFCGPGEVAQELVIGTALDEAKAAVRRRLAATLAPTS
jgi:ATP-dependent exoDNAse (exonuclease V) beta subunit